MNPPKYLTTKQIAEMCGETRRTIHNRLKILRNKSSDNCSLYPIVKTLGEHRCASHIYREDAVLEVLDVLKKRHRSKPRRKCTHCLNYFYPRGKEKHCEDCQIKFDTPNYFRDEVYDYDPNALRALYKVLTTPSMLTKFMKLTVLFWFILTGITIGVLYV